MLLAALRQVEGESDVVLDLLRKRLQILQRRSHPVHRLDVIVAHYVTMHIFACFINLTRLRPAGPGRLDAHHLPDRELQVYAFVDRRQQELAGECRP